MAYTDATEPHTHAHGHGAKPKSHWGMGLQLAFLVFALCILFHPSREHARTVASTFVSIVLEALPFVLLGTLIGGLVEVFVPRERMAALLPRRKWVTVLVAAGLGMIFPVCECAIVPVVRRLLRKGVPLGAAIAYLLGGPIVNPLVAGSTAVAYAGNWRVVIIRLACGYLIAVVVGLLMNLAFSKRSALIPEALGEDEHGDACCHALEPPASLRGKMALAVRHAADDFYDIGRFLVIGAFIAGLLQTMIARRAFASVMGAPAVSILLMMVMAVVLNLCSEADAFIAASFRGSPVPLVAQMAFMVLGPMLDIKLLLMYLRVFRTRAIVVLASLTTLTVFLAMVVLWWRALL